MSISHEMTVDGTVQGAQSRRNTAHRTDLFSDARGGFWAWVTTAFCVGLVAIGNLLLLAAALGPDTNADARHGAEAVLIADSGWVAGAGLTAGAVVGLAWWVRHGKLAENERRRAAVRVGIASGVATAFLGAVLFGIARLTATGRSLAWQPVVGLSLSVVAVAAFGGFYLASRRARVGFAASFILTFLVLLSYMLTLDGLAAAADGRSTGADGEELTAAASAIRELLTDFRGSVALIVGFYFGTDAAVSVVKMIKTSSGDPHQIARLDRDLAVPPPAG